MATFLEKSLLSCSLGKCFQVMCCDGFAFPSGVYVGILIASILGPYSYFNLIAHNLVSVIKLIG